MTETSKEPLGDTTQPGVDEPTEEQLMAAIASANHCFVAWRQTAPAEPAVNWTRNEFVPWPRSNNCSC
jgi:hypothetical protein